MLCPPVQSKDPAYTPDTFLFPIGWGHVLLGTTSPFCIYVEHLEVAFVRNVWCFVVPAHVRVECTYLYVHTYVNFLFS